MVTCVSATLFSLRSCNIDSIYNLGDSISDVGNLITEPRGLSMTPFSHLPYGETYFNRPTGRCSNGLLMIDYIGTYLFEYFLCNISLLIDLFLFIF